MKLFKKKQKQKLKYRVGSEVVFADGIELNKVTGQTILYMGNRIIFVVPKEISVQQTYDQSSCGLSATVLNYDIKNTLDRINKKETQTEQDKLMVRFLYKMKEYLGYVSGDNYHNDFPKKIETIYR